tara:strand:- start:103 stop:330 length:228 start_codon:yes stop_codon:yes gene_type:complete
MKAVPNLVYLKLVELSEKILNTSLVALKLVLLVPLNSSWVFIGCCVALGALKFPVKTVKKLKFVKNALTPKKVEL